MCKKGRDANEWGACKKSIVEQNVFRLELCNACQAKEKKKDK